MKIQIHQINIDLEPHNTKELERLARFVSSIDATLSAMELEIENYRQRLERIEEMTTRFESSQEES